MEEQNYEKAKAILKTYKQDTILQELENKQDKEAKQALVKQILSIDFEQIQALYEQSKKMPEIHDEEIENISYVDGNQLKKEEKETYQKIGEEIIKQGKYAVVTMAGGQGTRLGHKGPKGTFLMPLSPKPKYLFEILVETLKRNNIKYGITLPWYIMTSKENHQETVAFLEE